MPLTRTLLALAVALMASLALMGCSAKADVPTIGVNALAADPSAYTGPIAMKAVVQKVDAENASISVIDETEYATCGLTPCNSAGIIPLFLPTAAAQDGVRYSGELPKLEEVVVVHGEVKSSAQGTYFDVERIERGSKTVVEKVR